MCLLVVLLQSNFKDTNFNLSSKSFLIVYQPYLPKTTKLVISKIIANFAVFYQLVESL